MKEIKRKEISCSWIGRFNTVKTSVLPNLIIDSVQSQLKCQQMILWLTNWFVSLYWQTDQVYTERKKIQKKLIQYWMKRTKVRGLTIPISRLTIKLRYCGISKRQRDQWNRTGSPETDWHKHSQLIFDKGAKAIRWRKDSLSTNGATTPGQPHGTKNRHRP